MSDLINGLDALNEARPGYLQARTMYHGNATEVFTSYKLQQAFGSDSSEFVFNYARIVVQSRLSRIQVASITTQEGEGDDILADTWNANQLDQELQDAFEACLVDGDSYLIAWPSEDGVDIFFNDALDTRVFYQVENPRKKSYAIKRWMENGKLRVNLYYADRLEKYVTKEGPKQGSKYEDNDFEEYYDDESGTWPLPNETGQIPVFHLRTSRQYGQPEHINAYGPQNAINKLLGIQIDAMDFSVLPQRYFLEDPTANDGSDLSEDFGTPTSPFAQDEDDSAGLVSKPGGVWNLKGIQDVGQFDPTSPDVFVTPFKSFIEGMSTVTSTPMHAFNVGSLPSGESLRAAEAPLNKRVGSLELLLGSVLREMHEFVLDQYGLTDAKVIVTWAPAATYDDADVWATVKAKTEAGVPLRVALVEAGYTEAQVSEWYPEGAPAITPDQLDNFATAYQKLSAAHTLGTITKEEVRRAIPEEILVTMETADPEQVSEALTDIETLIQAGVSEEEARARVEGSSE